MKNKVIFIGVIVFILCIINSVNVYAISLNLDIIGDKTVEVDKTIQLRAEYWVGNEMEPNVGEVSREDVTNKSSWTRSNNNIATVDNTGKVTGVSEGTVTISAQYLDTTRGADRDATYEITVTPKGNTEYTGIRFCYDEPGPGMNLNIEDKFSVGLYNIPKTEKENIKFKIENENIAEITKTEYDKGWADAIATVKYLSVGKTKLIATLNYNGETYSDSYDLDVIEANETLELSAREYTNLPMTLKIGDKLQLTATLRYIHGSLGPKDVTSDGVIWTSSDEKVIKVDEKGLVTAIGEGTANITAKYKVGDETISAKYELKITDPTKSPVNPGNSSEPTNSSSPDSPTTKSDPTTANTILPKAGENATIMITGIVLIAAISVIMYKKYKSYKDIQ